MISANPFAIILFNCRDLIAEDMYAVVVRWKLAAFVALAASASAGAVICLFGTIEPTAAADTADRTKGLAIIAALGRVEPQSEIINIGSGIVDRLDTLLVRRGDRVKKDQILGYTQGYAEQIALRDQVDAQLAEARVKLASEIELSLAKIESTEIKLRQIKEVAPLRIRAQEASIANIEAMLANNRSILTAEELLLARNVSSQRNYNNQKTLVAQNEANLAAAQARLAEIKRQSEYDELDAKSKIRVAQATLERAKADYAIESLTKQLAVADARARRMTIIAPLDGRILNIMARAGEQVGSGPILSMGDTDVMRVVAEVYETDIARVHLAQRATITSRALARPIAGKVVEIGNMIFKNDVLNVDPAAKADARVVEVRIELDPSDIIARLTNLTVDVVIYTEPIAAAPDRRGPSQ